VHVVRRRPEEHQPAESETPPALNWIITNTARHQRRGEREREREDGGAGVEDGGAARVPTRRRRARSASGRRACPAASSSRRSSRALCYRHFSARPSKTPFFFFF
jgi:hypothetical protein